MTEEVRKYTQRLPARLHNFARDEAHRQRTSLNEYIVSLVQQEFEINEQVQTAEYLAKNEPGILMQMKKEWNEMIEAEVAKQVAERMKELQKNKTEE